MCKGKGDEEGALKYGLSVSYHHRTLGSCLFTSGHKQVSLFVNQS